MDASAKGAEELGHTCSLESRSPQERTTFIATPSPAGARAVSAPRPTTELPLRGKAGNPQAIIGDVSIHRPHRRMLPNCVKELSHIGHPHELERP